MSIIILYTVHSASLALLMFALYVATTRRRLYAALFAGLVLYQVLSYPTLPAYVEEFGLTVVSDGVILALFGAVALVMTVETLEAIFPIKAAGPVATFVEDIQGDAKYYLVIGLASFFVLLAIVLGRGASLLVLNWEEARSTLGFIDSIANLLQFVAFPICWILYRLRKRVVALLLLLVSISMFSILGSRAALLTIPAIAGLELYGKVLNKSKLYLIISGSLVLLLVLVFHVSGRFLRGFGATGLVSLLQGDWSAIFAHIDSEKGLDWSGGEAGVYGYYFFVIREGAINGAENLATVFRWFTIYLPRWLAPDFKPIDPTYALWLHAANAGLFDGQAITDRLLALLRQGDTGSVHALFWGEAWMNGGLLALASMSILLGALVVAIDRLFDALPATVFALLSPAAVVGYLMVARGNSVIGLGYIAYLGPPVIAGYVLLRLLLKRQIMDRGRFLVNMDVRASATREKGYTSS